MDHRLCCSAQTSVSKINMMLNQSYTPLLMTKCIWAHRWTLCSWGTRILQSDKALEVQSVHGKNDKWLSLWHHPESKCVHVPVFHPRERVDERETEWDWLRVGPHLHFRFISRFNCLSKKLHYLANLKGTFSSLSSSEKYFYHLLRAQVQLII